MNRHERRAAKAKAQHAPPDEHHQIAAIHEAGHAVAKVLAAAEMDYEVNDAISHIEMRVEAQGHMSADGKMLMFSQAVTFAPTFSKDIALAAHDYMAALRTGNEDGVDKRTYFSEVINRARTASADIGKWFRLRSFTAVAGPIAEAIFTNRPFGKVFWQEYAAESDLQGITFDGVMADIPIKEITATINKMAALAAYLMQDDKVWAAAQALANKLPTVGRMSGVEAVKIITGILPASDLTATFAEGLGVIARLETEIAAQPIVTASYPDGSTTLIKGIDRLTGKEAVTSVRYECKLPVFGEALWLAVGDGAQHETGDKRAA